LAGYHFRPALRNVQRLDDFKLVDAIVAQGGSFQVKTVNGTTMEWRSFIMLTLGQRLFA
jgi:hypothetical protein